MRTISYSCISHVGYCRKKNQDNYLCNGQYRTDVNSKTDSVEKSESAVPCIFGVFDGLGGEAMGEIASFLAAGEALNIDLNREPAAELEQYCFRANRIICEYADEKACGSMGTTAAIVYFSEDTACLCNIGDSRIMQYRDGTLNQISKDHVLDGIFPGRKPPLTQNIGIPEQEMVIEPYIINFDVAAGDRILLCSDGLTDMVNMEEIREIIQKNSCDSAVKELLKTALERGGKDNITIIICFIEQERGI